MSPPQCGAFTATFHFRFVRRGVRGLGLGVLLIRPAPVACHREEVKHDRADHVGLDVTASKTPKLPQIRRDGTPMDLLDPEQAE